MGGCFLDIRVFKYERWPDNGGVCLFLWVVYLEDVFGKEEIFGGPVVCKLKF